MGNNLGLPENLYSGGQGIFNSTPATNFYLQNQARKRARDEALTKYYGDFTKSINPAGMRNQDIDGLMQKKNDLQKYWYDNKDNVKNPTKDNGKAYTEFMSRYQDILNYSSHSKNEAEAKKPFVSLLTKPEVRSRLGQNGFDYVHQTDLPINDPNHVDFDMSHPSLDFSGKPITLDDQTRFLNSISTRIKPGKLYQGVQTKNGQVIRTYKSTYDPNDINAVISTSKAAVRDQKWDDLADSLHSDFGLYDDLNEKFNAVTGRHIQDNGDIIAAWTLASMNPDNTSQTASNKPRQSSGYGWGNGANQIPPSIQFSNDLTDAFASGNKENVKNVVGRLFAGNTSSKLEPEAYNILDNGQLAITFRPVGEDKYGDKKEAQQYLFDINDPDLKNKFVGLYQQLIGSDVKGENVTFREPQTNTPPKPQPKPKKKTAQELGIN